MRMKPSIQFHGGDDASGNVFMVETKAAAGTVLGQHAHDHAHLSYLVSGSATVVVDGRPVPVTGPCPFVVAAGKVHSVTAVTDIVWLCLWDAELGMQEEAKASLELVGG